MKRIYLVDSENVGDIWVPLLAASQPDEEVIVFYTQKSPHMNYENVRLLKETEKEAEFIKCFEGSNALDFQLVTQLGYLLCKIVGASSSNTKEGALPGWFISFVATVITKLQSGDNVCTVVGLVATVNTAGASGSFRSSGQPSRENTHIISGVLICATAPCNVPSTPQTWLSAPLCNAS